MKHAVCKLSDLAEDSSKAFTVGTKSRRARVKVTRRLRTGRYRLVMTGRSPTGAAASGTAMRWTIV